MKFSAIVAALSFGLASQAVSVSYDRGYDDPNRPLTSIACSDGSNGLITKYHWKTQGQITHFPMIGGSSTIGGWNSPQCGACYSLSYNGKKIWVLAIDHADSGFNIGLRAMNKLTNNQAEQLGRVNADVKIASLKACKIG